MGIDIVCSSRLFITIITLISWRDFDRIIIIVGITIENICFFMGFIYGYLNIIWARNEMRNEQKKYLLLVGHFKENTSPLNKIPKELFKEIYMSSIEEE
jgi:hypothetical protein